MDIVNT